VLAVKQWYIQRQGNSHDRPEDPIYIDQNQAFGFLLQITNSQYIPTQTLIKLVFKTDKGVKLSKPIYLSKPSTIKRVRSEPLPGDPIRFAARCGPGY
jgi:hypothetical protein